MCPLIDKSDPRCAGRHSLGRLDEALEFCADHYQDCPVYRKMPPRRRREGDNVAEDGAAAG